MKTVLPKTEYGLGKLIMIMLVVQLSVIAYIFYSDFQGRRNLVDSQRAGCERLKLDRQDITAVERAEEQYTHQIAANSPTDSVEALIAEEAHTKFETAIRALTKRAQIDCAEAYPQARLLP